MPEGGNTPNRYIMHSMTISNNEGVQQDIKSLYVDFEISESIFTNYIGGYVTILDGQNLFNRIGFSGQEYIRIHFSGIEGVDSEVPFEEQVDITCRIFKVDGIQKDNTGTTQQYRIFFISPQSLAGKRKRLSKAYSGSLSDITAKILKNELSIQDNDEKVPSGLFMSVREQSEPQNIHVVVPKMTINSTINWLVHNMSKEEGTTKNNYYFYQTARNGYKLNSVDDMMGIKYLNGEVVFGVPEGGTGDIDATYDDDGKDGRPGPGMDIYDITRDSLFNVEDNTGDGVYSGTRITYNPTLKLYQEIEYSVLGQEEYKINGEGEWEGGVHISKAPPFRIGKEKYHQPSDGHEGEGDMGNAMVQDVDGLNDSIITYKDAVIDFGYEPIYNINGVNKNTVGIHTDTGLHNFRRNAVRRMLETNSMNIVISGRTNINAGMVINLDLRQPIPGGDGVEPEIIQNGEMLITGLTFQATKDELVCQLTCASDGAEVNIDGYDAPPVPPNEDLEGQLS